jgi:hypothetical protein
MALDAIIKARKDGDKVFDLIRGMELYDKSKELDVKAQIEKLTPIFQKEKIDPAGEVMQDGLSNAVATLQRVNPEKAKKLSELQEELKKMKLA